MHFGLHCAKIKYARKGTHSQYQNDLTTMTPAINPAQIKGLTISCDALDFKLPWKEEWWKEEWW